MESERQSVEAINQSNDGYTTAGVIQLRLDTGPMLDQIEAFLRGRRISGYVENDGAMVPKFSPVGAAKLNDEGVQSIMTWLTPLFSAATVQGNFPTNDDLHNYVSEVEMDLSQYIWSNRVTWELKKEEVGGVIDMIIMVAVPFFSRLVNNKERESYGVSMVHKEHSTVEGGNKLLPF